MKTIKKLLMFCFFIAFIQTFSFNKNTKAIKNLDRMITLETLLVKVDTSKYEEEIIYKNKLEIADNLYTFQRRVAYNKTKLEIGIKRVKKPLIKIKRKLTIVEKGCLEKLGKLNNIHFDLNKHNIRPDTQLELNKAILIMNKCPNLRFVASSYTDSRGSDRYNKKLSKTRAASVVKYILKNYNFAAEIIGVGYGEDGLKNQCANGVRCTKKEHQENRRTEIELSEIK